MKKYILLVVFSARAFLSVGQSVFFLPNYNNGMYPTVLSAAKAVATPFLLRQSYFIMNGTSIVDSTITYNGIKYYVHQNYLNPATGYYVSSSQYGMYGITGFSDIWPNQFPNILFNASDTSFNAQSDCVGYLTRLLSATGDTSAMGNAYLNIINTTRAANTVPFAHTGYVATAYSFAVAFPTFPSNINSGWQYIAGNVEALNIDTYNHTKVSTLDTYNGVRKGGFGQSRPGDVLAFGYSASSSSNGHIMVMETGPRLLTADSLGLYFPAQTLAQATALLNAHHIYSLPVFDCSGQLAHFRDSRTMVSGIGHGTLLILTDTTDDAPTGFIFDSLQVTYNTLHMDTLGQSVYAIAVGRFVTGTNGLQGLGMLPSLLRVFPNPSAGALNIMLPGNDGGQITVYDVTGKIRFGQNVQSLLIAPNTATWPDGLYIIQYHHPDGTVETVKWIKE